ncbi:hypothetical protein 172859UKE1_054 [Escherichia phage vB_EcoM-172859UKE1]|nr:hypothetical protein 172859UKE1_054 [Escherichia phage vB_EcoM-172859UKE1]
MHFFIVFLEVSMLKLYVISTLSRNSNKLYELSI